MIFPIVEFLIWGKADMWIIKNVPLSIKLLWKNLKGYVKFKQQLLLFRIVPLSSPEIFQEIAFYLSSILCLIKVFVETFQWMWHTKKFYAENETLLTMTNF